MLNSQVVGISGYYLRLGWYDNYSKITTISFQFSKNILTKPIMYDKLFINELIEENMIMISNKLA